MATQRCVNNHVERFNDSGSCRVGGSAEGPSAWTSRAEAGGAGTKQTGRQPRFKASIIRLSQGCINLSHSGQQIAKLRIAVIAGGCSILLAGLLRCGCRLCCCLGRRCRG